MVLTDSNLIFIKGMEKDIMQSLLGMHSVLFELT